MSEVSDRLRRLAIESGKSYSQIEKETGIPKSALSRYLSGETGKIPLDRRVTIEKTPIFCGF